MEQEISLEDQEIISTYWVWWKIAMRELLGWPESRTLEWAQPLDEFIKSGAAGTFLHEAPAYYIIKELIPSYLRSRLHTQDVSVRTGVRTALQRAIENNQGLKCYSDLSYDWAAARIRVETILADLQRNLDGNE